MSPLHIRRRISGAERFLSRDIWDVVPATLPVSRRVAFQALRFIFAVGRGFRQNQSELHASALTYYTLMAVIPVLALALALGRVFGGAEMIRKQFADYLGAFLRQMAAQSGTADEAARSAALAFAGQLEVKAIELFDQINTISFGTLGGVGAVALIWMVIGLLGRVEVSFNLIWGVPVPRTLWRKFTDYLSVVLILPFLVTAASTVPVLDLLARGADTVGGAAVADTVRTVVGSPMLKQALVLGMGTITFSFLLIFMPNMRIRLAPGVAGGFLTAMLFGVWLVVCARLQIGIAKYSALYGGFALLPILLMWVYTSWQIILLGAEVTFALQNGATCRMESAAGRASPYTRFLLAAAFCAEAARGVREQGQPFDAEAFSLNRRVSSRLSQDVLEDLTRAGVLARIEGHNGLYLPCRDFSVMTVSEVAKTVLSDGTQPNELGLQRMDEPILKLGPKLLEALDGALAVPVADL
ncbi:MAG: YihY/virulence factor BrkB family protein [Lentisphaerae bacterium]|nr:YihY/virulence factor BrkB family protein [Lentisphaerota bacterium]